MSGGIGALRERITLERVSDGAQEGGAMVRSYTPLATLWAGLQPLKGRLQHLGQPVGEAAAVPTMTALIRLTPYVADLAPQRLDTFVHWPRRNRRFRVAAAEEVRGQGRFLALDLIEMGGTPS